MSSPNRSDAPASLDRWLLPRSRWTRALERFALALEGPVNRLIGNRQLNPFYHTGTIAVLLLGIVGITGVYIFMFFQYGFEASYNSVAVRIETPLIARVMRAVHRYASGALVVTTLLHAYRTLFMERFRGPRWLAWLTGIAMTFILWLAGITGYWLVWDQRAQVINEHFSAFLAQVTPWSADYGAALLRAERQGTSWRILLILLAVHVLLFLITAGFFWLHIRHLRRPRWLPELHWVVGAAVVLIVISAVFPSGMLPPADPNRLPGPLRLDPIFLYYLPLNETRWANWLWVFMWAATAAAAVLPWTRARTRDGHAPPPIRVLAEQCTGCTKCAQDCPYGAIAMEERRDGHPVHKLVAVADPARCVGCGICIGSCDDFLAITLGPVAPDRVWQTVQARIEAARTAVPDRPLKVILTCERHAAQGAAPFLPAVTRPAEHVEIIPLPCTGAVQPHILPKALAAGAAEVQIVGCPPFDCKNREGNLWEEQRVTHERVPRLRKRYDDAPITAAWLPPDQFALALPLTATPPPAAPQPAEDGDAPGDAPAAATGKPDYLSTRGMFEWLSWRNFVVGFVLLGVVLIAQIWLTGLPFTPYPDPPALIRVTLTDPKGRLLPVPIPWASGEPVPVRLEVDGAVVWEHVYDSAAFFASAVRPVTAEHRLPPGDYQVRLYWRDPGRQVTGILIDRRVALTAGEILRLDDLPLRP